jgi:hypothetical protein
MKKISLSIACLLALSFAAIPVGAQTRARCANRQTSSNRRYDHSSSRGYNNQVYRNDSYRTGVYTNQVSGNGVNGTSVYNDPTYGDNGYYGDNRSVWNRSRDKITTAAGAGGGAIIGSMIGGTRGAVVGAIAGGGAAALYTYKIRDKYRY